MKRLMLILFTLFIAGNAVAQSEKPATSKSKASGPEATLVAPDQLKWSQFRPGIEMATVIGNPKGTGQFILRLRATDDAKIPPHWHPTDEYVTVLSGEASVGMGRSWDDAKLKSAPLHGAARLPARMPHYAQFKKGAEVQVNGNGPFVVNYINPADDPARKK